MNYKLKDNALLTIQLFFLFVVYFVPTILPVKKALLVTLCVLAICTAVYLRKYKRNSFTELYILTLIPSFFSGMVSSAYSTDISLPIIALSYICLQVFGVKAYFSFTRQQHHLDLVVKTIIYFSLILALMLLFEAFFYSIYYHVFHITSLNPDTAVHFLEQGVDSKYGVTELGAVKYSRPFGPFRYPLLAGYALLLGSLFQLQHFLINPNLKKLAMLVILVFSLLIISKSSFLGFLIGAIWLILRARYISLSLKRFFLLSMFFVSGPVLYFVIISPIITGEGIGSFLIRFNILLFSINVFFDQPLSTIIFGHGLGFTWYGNEEFTRLYYDATADYGMYINTLIQGGLISIALVMLMIFKVVFRPIPKVYEKNTVLVEASYSFLVATFVVWVGLSNYDIIFWMFIAVGIAETVKRINNRGYR